MNRKIAIDTGKRTTKVVYEAKGNTSLRLSFETAMKENVTMTQDPTNHIVEYKGTKYLVGSQARTFIEMENTKNTQTHKICVLTALALACNSGDTVKVAIGCPLDIFFNEQERLSYRNNMLPLGKHTITVDGDRKTIEILSSIVLPECYGALYLKEKEFKDEVINVIDIGGLNLNAAVFKNGVLQEGSIVTLQRGGIVIAEESLKELRNVTDPHVKSALENLKAESIEYEIQKGFMKNIPESKDIFAKVRQSTVEDIFNSLRKHDYNFINQFYFMGGTSYLLKEEIIKKFRSNYCTCMAESLDDMQFINAQGFYMALKY